MTRAAIYAGSFDPVTNGHIDVVRSGCRLVDRLVLAVGVHPGKTPLFSAQERIGMLSAVFQPIATEENAELEVVTFDDLVISAAKRVGASILIRGLRDGSDLDYEMQMAGMNARLAPDLQTIFLPASPIVRPITATLVRQIAAMGGDVSAFVPPLVAEKLAVRFGNSEKGILA